MHTGFRAEIVDGLDEQVRLLPAHQIHVAHRPSCIAGQRRRPHKTCRAIAAEVSGDDGGDVIHTREDAQGPRLRSNCYRTG